MIITCWINQCIGSSDCRIVVNIFFHNSINNMISKLSSFSSFFSISSIFCLEKLNFSISQDYFIDLSPNITHNFSSSSQGFLWYWCWISNGTTFYSFRATFYRFSLFKKFYNIFSKFYCKFWQNAPKSSLFIRKIC